MKIKNKMAIAIRKKVTSQLTSKNINGKTTTYIRDDNRDKGSDR